MCSGSPDTGYTEDQVEDQNRQARIARQRQQAIIDQQTQEAREFRDRIPTVERDMNEALVGQSRRQLAQDLSANKTDLSRRGLLTSKIKDMRAADIRAEAGANLAEARTGVTTRLNDQARRMDSLAAQGQMQAVQQRQDIEDDVYARAMQKIQQRNSAIQGMSQVGGIGAGYAYSRMA